jgi:dephospho-CoA kinase
VLCPDGSLDRAALARRVFGDDNARADLEAITHPAVGQRIAERLSQLAAAGDHEVVVLDIPLLAEKGRGAWPLAAVLVVDAPVDVAIRRLVEGRGMDEDDARARVAAQAGREARLSIADFVIDNSGSLEDLEREVERAWRFVRALPDRGARAVR